VISSWRCVDTGVQHGAYNMAIDEALVESVEAGGLPVVRFYAWEPPAISFGFAQQPQREVDIEACRAMGVDLVRRPTGGRAVLHWQELTYSVIVGMNDEEMGGRIENTYRRIGECLVAGLRRFGADVELERAQIRQPRSRARTAALPCFSSIARSEIKWKGRKLIGSAQRRYKRAVLQHGSLVIGREYERLVDLLLLDDEERVAWRRGLRADSACLEECMGRRVVREELVEAMVAGFEEVLMADLVRSEVTANEWDRSLETADTWSVEVSPVERVR
jgi:lipoyl(octanoyl) transferase